jgi:hypothetical protein
MQPESGFQLLSMEKSAIVQNNDRYLFAHYPQVTRSPMNLVETVQSKEHYKQQC